MLYYFLAPLKEDEYQRLMLVLEREKFGKYPNQKSFNQLSKEERAKLVKQRIQGLLNLIFKSNNI